MKKKGKYISNKKLYQAIISYKSVVDISVQNSVDKPQITNYIGECILLICNNLAKKPNFSNYTYKDEFISDAIIDCLSAVENFDANKTNNPFAYFTQIAWNAFVRRIHKEHKQTYIKHKNYEQLFIINDFYDDNDSIKHKNNELSNEVIKSFEDKIVKIKKIQKKYGLENL
jgi:hypothetical protein